MGERICWIILGLVIHVPPFAALFMPSLITRLYGVAPDDVNFALLHHRAALFGILVIACLWAAFDPGVRKLSFVVTALSMVSFLIIYSIHGAPDVLRSIAVVDLIGLPFLAFVGWKAFSSS
ncbi:hypothetical protein [Parasphingorhabdus cellanae]|uniref:Phosphopantetheine adenylyltransferase n=1 Tax=Parasphingorhabdus cellanae TaxID=2806553 RepID=A0ABX7T4S0_9SPHN|nr:hypothetical protein [Parasphingorhabdus cellanae]QTD56586.1 hypothetical protein J4G78_03060 [Parasphingorhabdus cellanae]